MKLKESTFKLLSLLFIILFTHQKSIAQRIDTDIGDNGLYPVTESNYQYVLNYENTFLCFLDNTLTFYDDPGEPDYDSHAKFDKVFKTETDYLLAKINIQNNEANFAGSVRNAESGNLEFAKTKINLTSKEYIQSFGKQGVFINNSPEENEELTGYLELEDRTLLYGSRGSSALLMEIDKDGKKIENSSGNEEIIINHWSNFRFLHILDNEDFRFYFFKYKSIEASIVYMVKLEKSENITQEIFDAEKIELWSFPDYSILSSFNVNAKIVGNKFIVAFRNWCERGTYVLNLDDFSELYLDLDKLALSSTIKNTHILDDGTILVTGILDKEYAHRLFVYALSPDGELRTDFGIGGFYFPEIGAFSESMELNNTFYNNDKLIFSISDPFTGNYFIPIVFDELVKAPEKELVEFTFHPNPTLDFIKLVSDELSKVTEYRIFDDTGRLIEKSNHDMNTELIIDVSRFTSSTYIMSFYANNKLIGTQKFVKI